MNRTCALGCSCQIAGIDPQSYPISRSLGIAITRPATHQHRHQRDRDQGNPNHGADQKHPRENVSRRWFHVPADVSDQLRDVALEARVPYVNRIAIGQRAKRRGKLRRGWHLRTIEQDRNDADLLLGLAL